MKMNNFFEMLINKKRNNKDIMSTHKEQNIKLKEYNNHIQKIFNRFENNEIPVNIIRLCEHYKWKPMFANKNSINFSGIITKEMFKEMTQNFNKMNINEYDYFLLIIKDKPIKQRLNIAILFSTLYMVYHNLCTSEEFKSSVFLKENINTESPMYKFAIMLLCPKFELEELIRESGHTPMSLLSSHLYKEFIEKFLISPLDFEYRLNLLHFEGV